MLAKDFTAPQRPVTRVFLHCSASDHANHDDVSVMRQWHMNPPNNWADVGYHFFIKKDGTIQPGRDLEEKPAAQAPHNLATIAICAHGLAIEKFTDVQLASVKDLCEAINRAYDGKVTFHGHREVANKTCPVFDYRALLGLDDKGRMRNPETVAA
jgi:N-acetylmuramoyl-L-alanine amidase